MTKGAGKPSLTPVDPAVTMITPPRQLGPHGMNLWSGMLAEFDIRDRAGLELLAQPCACLDRAESLAEQIEVDGVVVCGRNGTRIAGRCVLGRIKTTGLYARPYGGVVGWLPRQ